MGNKSYERTTLFQTDAFEIVSIVWNDKSVSPLHDHGWSQCFVKIEEGVFENTLDLGIKREVKIYEAGQVISTPVGARHEIRCKSHHGKTLHVYTPKLQETDEPVKFQPSPYSKLREKVALSSTLDTDSLIDLLKELRLDSISTQSPYFMNQLFSGILPQALMAEEFIAQTKTTLATFEASPVLSSVENEVVDRLCGLIGWPDGQHSGVSVPGGSAANFMAIHCARQMKFPDIKTRGMAAKALKIFVSSESHYSFKKACTVLGIGIDNLVHVPSDSRGKMLPEALDELIVEHRSCGAAPLLVGATAGTTVLGAFDDLSAISQICKRHDVWLHVDGAWGGPALFTKKLRPLVRGIECADSMTFDAHKLFGANLTSSFFLTKHPNILLEANDVSGADYLFHADDPSLDRGKLSWQCGRKGDAMSFWTLWKNLGTDGLGNFIDRLVGIREEILPWIKDHERLELVAKPDYLNICVRVLDQNGQKNPEWSKTVRERLKEKNLAFVNYSVDRDGTFLRLILANPYLNFHHVRQILEWALGEA